MSTNIMIVDDEKDIADLVQIYLENDGFKVFKFYNGKDALECALHEKLDLAILDVMLPDTQRLFFPYYHVDGKK